MKNSLIGILSCFFLLLNQNSKLFAQAIKCNEKVIVILHDNEEYKATILSDDETAIFLLTEDGNKIYLKKEDIKKIIPFEDVIIEGKNKAILRTHHFLTTNALPLKKKEKYVMLHFFGPEFCYGLNNRLSIGLTTSWGISPFLVSLKYSIPTKNEKITFGLETKIGSSGFFNAFEGYGAAQIAMVTFKYDKSIVTLSGGYSLINIGSKDLKESWNKGISDNVFYYVTTFVNIKSPVIQSPFVSISVIGKGSKKVNFIFESMFIWAHQRQEEKIFKKLTKEHGEPAVTEITQKKFTEKKPLFYLLPGLRFQTSKNKTFQFGIGILKGLRQIELDYIPRPILPPDILPLAMCSWSVKF